MKRVAFKMKLRQGFAGEYKKRHDRIWPELAKEITEAGISEYSIFLDEETNILFAVQNLSEENSAGTLPGKEIIRKWWDYMADIMEVNPDNSPVVKELREVFYLQG